MKYPDMESLAEAKFLVPAPRLVPMRTATITRRLLIVERDERLMQQWRESFPGDVRDEEEFFAMKREERIANRHRRRTIAEQELENPNTMEEFESDGPMWNDLWTETTSDDDE
jgi:hypothetical protein